jgi:tetratricopeptide (TPR) repeat protein
MKRFFLFVQLLIVVIGGAMATPLEEALDLFRANEPAKARPLFEEALALEPNRQDIYVNLGIVYEQLGEHGKAINILQRGLEVGGNMNALLYTQIGNNFVARGENLLAEEMYTRAIGLDRGAPEPHLNRANARVTARNYEGALADYNRYLALKPTTAQRAEIEKMIALLNAYLQKKQTEAQEAAARERALMEQVLNALKNASEDARNLSTGSDDILEEKEDEIDIEE